METAIVALVVTLVIGMLILGTINDIRSLG